MMEKIKSFKEINKWTATDGYLVCIGREFEVVTDEGTGTYQVTISLDLLNNILYEKASIRPGLQVIYKHEEKKRILVENSLPVKVKLIVEELLSHCFVCFFTDVAQREKFPQMPPVLELNGSTYFIGFKSNELRNTQDSSDVIVVKNSGSGDFGHLKSSEMFLVTKAWQAQQTGEFPELFQDNQLIWRNEAGGWEGFKKKPKSKRTKKHHRKTSKKREDTKSPLGA